MHVGKKCQCLRVNESKPDVMPDTVHYSNSSQGNETLPRKYPTGAYECRTFAMFVPGHYGMNKVVLT